MLNSRFKKTDAYGQVLKPGDVCAYTDNRKISLIVYVGVTWGGNESKGEFGRFITATGARSIKYSSVVFVFDPMGKRRAQTIEVNKAIRNFYEGF